MLEEFVGEVGADGFEPVVTLFLEFVDQHHTDIVKIGKTFIDGDDILPVPSDIGVKHVVYPSFDTLAVAVEGVIVKQSF